MKQIFKNAILSGTTIFECAENCEKASMKFTKDFIEWLSKNAYTSLECENIKGFEIDESKYYWIDFNSRKVFDKKNIKSIDELIKIYQKEKHNESHNDNDQKPEPKSQNDDRSTKFQRND